MKHSHETKTKRAKCLHYRNNKRCGRVAKHEVSFTDNGRNHHQSVCDECLDNIQKNCSNVYVNQSNKKGFRVVVVGFGYTSRTYKAIE